MSDTATSTTPQAGTMERPQLQGVVPYLTVRGACDACGLALADHDTGDGPAVAISGAIGYVISLVIRD